MRKKQRRLAAIMFTDIVGYSSMMQKSEEIANRLRVRHREVFQRLHERFEGEILQYYGDGTLSIFPSAVSAVECGVALQQALKKEPKVPIRIGIHTGDITFDEQEVYGDGVNVAARIESLCVPGGVFISGKVYDDIKNHSRLKARPMGGFKLKNIAQDVPVFTITNDGVTVPEYEWQPFPVQEKPPAKQQPLRKGRKSKWVAAILALLFGIFGAHRFYLGQRNIGILFLAFFFVANFVFPAMSRFLGIPAIIGFIDFVAFLAMPRATFDEKYNHPGPEEGQAATPAQAAESPHPKQILADQFEQYREKGIAAHRNYDYDSAIDNLIKAIEVKYDDPEAHFLLACCYSVNEETEKALSHLDVAVAFGLPNPGRINTHDDLSYLRVQPAFERFKENGFRLVTKELPPPTTEWMEAEEEGGASLLEQLSQLQRQWRAGELTEEEYRQRQEELKKQ
ncbi:MAG: NINE protein [Phaeodactylibacter sp.]|nr:NINE protein [Phaeodactylibacter sp.]